jgi:hypothetical protein
MDDIFTAFDVSGVSDRPGELGAFSVESLYVRYDFTRQDMIDAFDAITPDADLPDPVKTILHETTHLFHTITTPFGFLVYALRRLQATMVGNAIIDLRRMYGLSIRYPLIHFARQLPPEVQRHVQPYFRVWYECELFILFALDGFEAWNQQFLRNPMLRGMPVSELFSRTQSSIAINYRTVARNLRNEKGLPGDDLSLPFADYVVDEFPGEAALAYERLMSHTRVIADDLNMIFITESAGTFAESWGIDAISLDVFWQRFRKSFSRRGLGNLIGLHILEGKIPTSRLSELVLSYLTLCELALFGPVLPHHRRLRQGHSDVFELIPFLRWWRLIGAAAEVQPMRSLDDYERYTRELCQVLKWVTPTSITGLAATQHVAIPFDMQEALYVEASRYRREVPGLFLDYGWVLRGEGETHLKFLSQFNFPVIQYRDQTFYHRDQELLHSFTRWYLLRAALRSILLRRRIALRLPYRPRDAEEVSSLRETLLDDLQDLTGIRVRNLTLTWRQPRGAHTSPKGHRSA